jgi:hypothetical protein
MMAGILISYSREDSIAYTGARVIDVGKLSAEEAR